MTPTPATGTLTYVRELSAPRELVFRCLLEPAHLTHFWGPTGTSTPLGGITVDPRPGGAFETVMVSDADGSRYVMRAVYDEIAEPERIVWTDRDSGLRSTSTLVDLGDGRTEVTIVQTHVPAPFLAPEARAGFATSLDRFSAYVASVRSSSVRS